MHAKGYVLTDDEIFPILALFGADGDDDSDGSDGGDDGDGTGAGGDEPSGDDDQESSSNEDGGKGREKRTYNEAYVKRLRKEAADLRVKGTADKATIKEFEDRDKSDVDKAKDSAASDKTLRMSAEERLQAREMTFAVGIEAGKLNFHDAEDAAALLDVTDITIDDLGVPDREQVVEALEKLAKDKPHLVSGKSAPKVEGGGDGSEKGKPKKPLTQDQQADDQEKKFLAAGMVPAP